MLDRMLRWPKAQADPALLTGWALDVSPESRAVQLTLARNRSESLMAFMSDQESKVVTLFGVATLLVTASGVFGELRVQWSLEAIPDIAVVLTSAAAWAISLAAYRPRRHNLGPDPAEFRERFSPRFSADELEAFELESWVIAYEENAALMSRKGYWLRRLMLAVVAQAAAIVAAELIGG